MNEYDNVVQSFTEAAPAMATTALDANPDKAARALQLSRATGVAPLVISADQDRFEEDHRAQMTADIVRGNSQLAAYIRGNPLADHVSNDDYGNLDNASRAFQDSLDNHPIWGKGLPKTYIGEPLAEGVRQAFQSMVEGFGYDFNKGDFNFYIDKALDEHIKDFTKNNPYSTEAYRALELIPRAIVGTVMAPINAAAGLLGGSGSKLAENLGYDSAASQLKRELPEVVMQGVMGGAAPHADAAMGQIIRANEAARAAKPWLDAGVDVPRGVHSLIDQIKEKTNDAWIDKIQNALQEAQNSATRERDPELFKNFAKQHFADAQMGISADAVVRLYGDKLPSREDGILGWVPGIEEKLEAARTFGEDVHVPLADWVTYVDPQLASELKPDLRAWPGGITKNEAAVKDLAAPAIGASKEIAPIKEVAPEFEPITLDQRLDAYREEFHNMLEDATFDERGIRQPGLRDALDVVSSPFGISGDRGREALDLAIKHDRPDIAEALVQRAENAARKSNTTPGVSETSPKYNDIKKNLERLKKEAEDYAAELREKLNASKLKNDTLIDGALPQVRTSAALEPMFAIGDRPLKLEKGESIWKGMEDYNFVDHTGKVVGEITIFPDPMKKQLYIASVSSHDLQPNTMGPSLIRDIKRQLKELYPEYETISGYRISGAREEAGAPKEQRKPVVKLALGDAFELSREYTDLRRILETAPTKFGDVTADLVPKELWTTHERAIGQAVQEEINRITGRTAEPVLASDLRYEGIDGIRGVYHQAPGEIAKILVNMHDFDATGIARHEAIHHLYREGFFKPEEWNALIEASKNEGWIDRYQIADRYDHLNELGLHEEAIAEAFRDWAKTREQQPVTPITTIFQKLWDLMQRIKDRVAKILGREPRFDELFEAAYSGKLAQRANREGEGGQVFAVGDGKEILYHGTSKDKPFDKFREAPNGTWFTTNPKEASQYAVENDSMGFRMEGHRVEKTNTASRVAAMTHDFKNTLEITEWPERLMKDNYKKAQSEWFAELRKEGYDSVRLKLGDGHSIVVSLDNSKLTSHYSPEPVKGGPKFAKGKEPPPLDEGKIRYYHGAAYDNVKDFEGKTFLSPNYDYARNYRGGPNNVFYTDFTREEAIQRGLYDEINNFPKIGSIDDGAARLLPHTIKESTEAKTESTPKQKEELQTQLKAEAAGLDAKSFKRIQDLIQKRYQEDIAAAMKRAEAEQKTLQSKEWKEASKEIRKEVDADIRQRPDVAADLLIGSGELGGKQLERKNYPLRAEDLTEAQKASLPRRYYSKDGVPVDMMANLFGFTSGDRLIEELSSYTKSREGMSAQEGLRKTIDEEVQRRMEEKFGKLQDNIMLDAMDQALSETNLQILAEEWQGAAMAAGVKVVDKDLAKGEALAMFGKMKLVDINVERLMGIMGKIGRDTERLLIAGKNADALVLLQRKYMTGLIAAEARKVQKEQASFEKTAKQFSKREVTSVDPEYTNYIHQILMQVGKPVRRSVQDLAHQMEGYGGKNLEEFVQEKAGALREIPVWDQLYDSNWNKSFDQLTADEFRALHNSIKTLVHNGRDEMKIMRQGEAEDLAIVKQQMIQNVIDATKGEHAAQNKGSVKKFLSNYYVGHLQMENVFNRWDGFDSKGVWNQYIMRDLIDGANQKDAWLKEYAHQLKQLPEPEGLTRTLDNPLFKDQDTGAALPFTRKNLIAVMLNTGNSSNLAKLAKGYKIEPNDVMAWVHQHASAKDWEFVQGIWDMFADIKKKSDTMYRSLTGGVAPENIPIRPIDTPHGQFKGGYYPVIFHSEMEGKSKKLMGKDPLEQENYVRATTPAGYTKTRTGYAAPMALELDAMPGRIGQMLHDIALRPAVLNAAKIFYDHDVRSAIRAHFGAEYRDELVPYLRGVANASNYESKAQTTMNQMSEFIRQNMITTLVGLNPGTVMKHGPTAAVLSVREVGAEPFAKAVRGMFSVNEATGESNWQFAIKNSLELQRRDRNWAETLYGSATGVLAPGDKLTPMRQKIMELSSKPVALSDMISAVPTWLAKYESEINAGATHGDAVYEADRSVRRAHGSTAITTRTAMMRNSNPWLVSIYNFFSDVMNRQMETIWKAGETKDLVKQGEWKEASKTVPALTASLFAYAIWPAIVETWVSPHPHKDDDSWLKKSAMAMTFALGSSWVGVRDIASALTMGRDPQFGLTGTAYQTMTNTFRDLAKKEPFNKEHAGKILQDAGIMVGGLTGMLPAQVSKSGRFMFDVGSGQQKPKGLWQWLTGLRYGTVEKHPATFEDYLKGKH